MSEKESKFINWLSTILGSFLLVLAVGLVGFVRAYDRSDGMQSAQIEQLKIADKEAKDNMETIRVEIRQDLKEIKNKVDRIAESQVKNSEYYYNQKN